MSDELMKNTKAQLIVMLQVANAIISKQREETTKAGGVRVGLLDKIADLDRRQKSDEKAMKEQRAEITMLNDGYTKIIDAIYVSSRVMLKHDEFMFINGLLLNQFQQTVGGDALNPDEHDEMSCLLALIVEMARGRGVMR